jgi:hemoglobin-like flavoprotein
MEQTLSDHDVAIVQQSYKPIAEQAVAFGNDFYDNLFIAVPEAATLFPPNNPHQTIKLMLFLETGINNLSNVEKVAPLLRDLGVRHIDYGVLDEHYDYAESALIKTLKERIALEEDSELEHAWRKAYRALTFHMRDAAKKATPAKKGFWSFLGFK